ncbi:MAG: hypothetical protein WKF66_02180 [Pedobacter sp.]
MSRVLLIVVILIVFNFRFGISQVKRDTIYYLADTTGVSPSNQLLVINDEVPNTYIFLCKCIPPNNAFLAFIYNKEPTPLQFLPKHKYLAWWELQEIAFNSREKFNDKYVFYIVEKLNKGYQIVLVEQKIFKLRSFPTD